jgi:hypothetical protein
MPITGTPKDLSDRSFLTSSPFFNGLACFYWGGSNQNLLVGRSGQLGSGNYSYVNSPIAGVTGGKAILGETRNDAIYFPPPSSPLTNDLPGDYGDFTVLYYGRVISGNNAGCFFNFRHATLDQYIRAGSYTPGTPTPGEEANFIFQVKGASGDTNVFSGGCVQGEFACFAFRRQGNVLSIHKSGSAPIGDATAILGLVTLDGTTDIGSRDFNSQQTQAELSLLVVYKRALSNAEIATLNTNPFAVLPAVDGTPPPTSQWRKEATVYHVGNSVTDTIQYTKLRAVAAANDVRYEFGRQMIPGAPLEWLRDHPNDGFTEQPYGYPAQALPNNTWNVLTLQPFDRPASQDIIDAQYFANLLYSRPSNATAKILIYSRWARQRQGETYNFPAYWAETNTSSNFENKLFFEQVLLGLRAALPGKPIFMAPVGDAMLLFDSEAKAGRVPGFSQVLGLFADGIHLNDVGAYLVGCVFYATIYGEDPAPLGFAQYSGVNQVLADKIQAIAWDTVDGHPYSGVDSTTLPPPPTPMPSFGCTYAPCNCESLPCVEIKAGQVFDQVLNVDLDGKPLPISLTAALSFTVKRGNATIATMTAVALKDGVVRLKLTRTQTLPLSGQYSWTGTIVDGAKTTTFEPGEFWVREV